MIPLPARRTFRFGAVAALSLWFAYALEAPFPFFAPLFAVLMTATPGPPMGPKMLFKVLLVLALTLGIGLLLAPVLRYYPITGVLVIAVGLFLTTFMSVGLGKGTPATLLTIGLTMIPAAGLMGHELARSVIQALLIGVGLAIACQWLVYPLFPEDAAPPPKKQAAAGGPEAAWIALRTMLIVLPPVLLAFSNPSMYMATIMKTVMLGQQGSAVSARRAGVELLGSTLLAGVFAMTFWFGLKLWPSLWMFALWMGLFGLYFGGKLYGVRPTQLPGSFWVNVAVTMLILLGPAVEDSAGGDVYAAFVQRFFLFVAVTLYAWMAILVLERVRTTWSARRVRTA